MKRLKKKDFLLPPNELIEKVVPPRNAKEHYQSFIRKKKTKSGKQSKTITQQRNSFENSNIVDIKSVITEHPKTSNKSSKTIRQVEKVSQVGSHSSLYSDTKK